jgi:C4-dicarboxylate-specific signal transduction histidine kinase
LREWNEELNARVDQRTAELREANRQLEATTKQLVMSEKLAAIGEITAGIAHEINNPVAVIQGNVDNAVQAMGETGHLALHLAAERRNGQDGVCLRVADSGPGLDPATLDSVFDAFFTTRPGEGTGLGLSISQTIVQKAGGIITAVNRPEGGAEFRVWLPRAQD